VTLTGVAENPVVLQTFVVIAVMAGVGFIVTEAVAVPAEQLPEAA
jgi:hypothetical protein